MSSDRSHQPHAIGPASPNETQTEIETDVVRTYLAMDRLDQLRDRPPPPAKPQLECIDPCSVSVWRRLYADIGAPWKWHDRDAWPDERLAAHLARAEVQVFHLRADALPTSHPTNAEAPPNDAIGFFELERHHDGSVEIVYLGLDLRVMGMGLGAWFIAAAVRQAFTLDASRVWLHTCTLDSPAALPNYIARGFTPERTETYTARIRPS